MNITQRAQSDIEVLDLITILTVGMDEYIHGPADRDEGLKRLAKGAVKAVADLQEPPHAMLLEPLLEYAKILVEGLGEDRDAKMSKLQDLACITRVEIGRMKAELEKQLQAAA
jgi:hypothetical protein